MLRHSHPGHVEPPGQSAECLTVTVEQLIKKPAPRRVSKCLELQSARAAIELPRSFGTGQPLMSKQARTPGTRHLD
jgi:hypothetical protein